MYNILIHTSFIERFIYFYGYKNARRIKSRKKVWVGLDNFNFEKFKEHCERLKKQPKLSKEEKQRQYDNDYRRTLKGKVSTKRYCQSAKGKIVEKRRSAKRRRSLGFILMFPNPFDDSILVDYHHITDTYVVTIPRDLHQLCSGKNHRELCMNIVNQIYL